MKKMMIAALMLLTATTFASSGGGKKGREDEKGNHISVSQVPGWVQAQFWSMFPTATNVRWESEKEHGAVQYKAEFYINGQKMKARF